MPSTTNGILADVNVWLATIVEGHPHHAASIDWWRNDVLPSGRCVCFCRVTQLGLLRLLTNELVMGPSRRTPQQAWQDYDQMLEQPVIAYLEEPAGLTERLRGHTSGATPSPHLWTDAYLAAFAQAARLELATFDRGFRRFNDLGVRTLA